MQLQEILKVLAALQTYDVDYALMGAVALNLHGIARATEDLDFFVRPDADNIERLRQALRSVYGDPSIDEISTEDLLGDYPAVRYFPPGTDLYLDILTRLGEVVSYEDLEVTTREVEGVNVRLVSPKTLYWMKRDTVRPQDRVDAQYLQEKFDIDDADLKPK